MSRPERPERSLAGENLRSNFVQSKALPTQSPGFTNPTAALLFQSPDYDAEYRNAVVELLVLGWVLGS